MASSTSGRNGSSYPCTGSNTENRKQKIQIASRTRDRIEKRDLYEQYGVREYWIIDPEARTVEALALEPTSYRLAGSARAAGTVRSTLIDGFSVQLHDLFAGITGGV